MRRCFVGWRFAYPTWGPCDLSLIYPLAATETAGAGGLKIAETFPEGRGTGAAATGRPLCAPCTMSNITQKKYRERNLPGNNTEAVALPDAARTGKYSVVTLFRRMAADALSGLQDPHTGSHPVGPCKRSAAGQQYPALPTSPGWQSEQRPHQKSPVLAPPAQQ